MFVGQPIDTLCLQTVEGHEVMLELPGSLPNTEGRATGVLVLLHGCSHSAGDFWAPSEACRQCLGAQCVPALQPPWSSWLR